MYDWHKAYESKDLKDIIDLFVDSDLRKDAALEIMDMLLKKPDSRRGAILTKLIDKGYTKATLERSLKDLEQLGFISSEGKYLKTGRYRVNLTRFSSSLNRLSRTVKKIEGEMGE